MSTSYQLLPLAQVKPGMVLSDILHDSNGNVLLPQGAVLSESIIAALPRHGIDSLPIRSPDGPDEPDPINTAAEHAMAVRRLQHIFRKYDAEQDQDWATGILQRYVEDFRLDREVEQ